MVGAEGCLYDANGLIASGLIAGVSNAEATNANVIAQWASAPH
jgi:hypothetical protein